MNPHKKQKLFPFLIMFKLNEQIGDGKTLQERSDEETQQLMDLALKIKDDEKAFDQMIEVATTLPDEEWLKLEQEYTKYIDVKGAHPSKQEKTEEAAPETIDDIAYEDSILAKKGAKLKDLQSYKKGKVMKKKCSCGCEIVSKKEHGGKLVSKCSCGCEAKKETYVTLTDKVRALSEKKLPKTKLMTKPMNAVDTVVEKMQRLKKI